MLKIRIIVVFLMVLVCLGSVASAHTPARLSDILDDFPLNSTLSHDNISKYYDKVTTNIERNGKILTSIKFNTSSGESQEIVLLVTEDSKIVNIEVRFFKNTQDFNVLNILYDNLLPTVMGYYGKPTKERTARFDSNKFGNVKELCDIRIKQAYFNEHNKYQYFFGAFQRPAYVTGQGYSGSFIRGDRGVAFHVQSTGYYSEIW